MKLLQLRIIRMQNNLTQQQIADVLGVSRSTYSSYESGRRSPDIDTIAKLSMFFKLPMEKFVGDMVSTYVSEPSHYEQGEDTSYLSELSNEERDLVVKFRIMTEKEKKDLLESISKKSSKR